MISLLSQISVTLQQATLSISEFQPKIHPPAAGTREKMRYFIEHHYIAPCSWIGGGLKLANELLQASDFILQRLELLAVILHIFLGRWVPNVV